MNLSKLYEIDQSLRLDLGEQARDIGATELSEAALDGKTDFNTLMAALLVDATNRFGNEDAEQIDVLNTTIACGAAIGVYHERHARLMQAAAQSVPSLEAAEA